VLGRQRDVRFAPTRVPPVALTGAASVSSIKASTAALVLHFPEIAMKPVAALRVSKVVRSNDVATALCHGLQHRIAASWPWVSHDAPKPLGR
jgi:hypothetical protein